MKHALILLALPLALGACATGGGGGAGGALRASMGDAIVAPLRDLNLMRKKAPAALMEASRAPYRIPDSFACATLNQEIAQLDAALGPDIDSAPVAMSLSLRGSQMASDAAVDAVEDLTTGWIPYRGLVRQVTGASRNDRARENAVRAGVIRRAYLKGMRVRENCDGLDEAPVVEAAGDVAVQTIAASGQPGE